MAENDGRVTSVTSSSGGMEDTLTFEDVIPGIKRVDATTNTCLGKVRSCGSLTKLEVAFMIITFFVLLSSIGITCYKLIKGQEGADFTFSILLLFNCCLSLYYVLSGVFFERPYELGILVVSSAALWLYVVLNYAISMKGPQKLARLIISSALSPLVIVIGVLLSRNYHESKNLIFRTVGANAKMQDICNTLFIFIGLLKLDLQISMSLAILLLSSGKTLSTEDMVMLPLALVIGLATYVFGYFAIRLENKILTIVYLVMWLLMPAYAIFLIVEAGKDIQDANRDPPMEIAIYAVLFVTAAGCLVMRVVLLYFGVQVYLNFGKGLRQKVFGAAYPTPPVSATEKLDYPINEDPINEEAEDAVTS